MELLPRLNAALQGRYRLERALGEGGMATVYLATDLRHQRAVALKVLKPELAMMLGAERFLAEITTTANLHHPHILPLYDSGEADSHLFYTMPYVEGETLRQRLDREGRLKVDEATRLVVQIAEALQAAHDRGVVHRDLKPSNILLSRGQPLVADFGIARATGGAGVTRLTQSGMSIGTLGYMSPEQASGDPALDHRTDIYSLGCVLFEMLTGAPPHPGRTALEVLAKQATDPVPSVRVGRPEVSQDLDRAVSTALALEPARRYETMSAFAAALAARGADTRHGVSAARARLHQEAVVIFDRVAAAGGWPGALARFFRCALDRDEEGARQARRLNWNGPSPTSGSCARWPMPTRRSEISTARCGCSAPRCDSASSTTRTCRRTRSSTAYGPRGVPGSAGGGQAAVGSGGEVGKREMKSAAGRS